MKNIILTATLSFFLMGMLASNTMAESFIGIEEYIAKNNGINNKYDEGFIHLRCSGLIMAVIKYIPSAQEKFRSSGENQFAKAGLAYIALGQATKDEVMKQIGRTLLSNIDHYYLEIENKQTNEGDIFTGQLAREFNFCLKF